MEMGKRRLKRKQKEKKIRMKIRIAILSILFLIGCYVCFGIYRENKIRLQEEKTMPIRIEKMGVEEQEIKQEKVEIEEEYMGFDVLAKLEIPSIGLDTNILKDYTKEGMKVCASKFWGPDPNAIGNFCIAGHNYEKENMFHHLIDLEVGDELFLSDRLQGKVAYTIYDIYKVKPQNINPLSQETGGKRVVTLITCVNYSKNRLIVQAAET